MLLIHQILKVQRKNITSKSQHMEKTSVPHDILVCFSGTVEMQKCIQFKATNKWNV